MDNIIPCFVGMTFFLGLFGLIAFFRFLSYREMLVLAEKGLVRAPRSGNGKDTLRWGIVITMVGLALCIGLYPLGFMAKGSTFPLGFGPWLLVGLVPTFFGLALLLVYWLAREKAGEEPQKHPAHHRHG
jgi:hypothetical protein